MLRHDAPATRWEDAFLTGNGRHGALVFGDPHAETVIVTHHRLTVPNGSEQVTAPDLADRLDETRDLILAGESAAALARFTDDRDLVWVEPFHPAFAIRLRLPSRKVTEYQRTTDFTTGVVCAEWTDEAGSWQRSCFVSRADDVLVQHLVPPPGWTPELSVTHDVRLPGAPASLVVRPCTPGDDLTGVRVEYDASSPVGYLGLTRTIRTADAVLLLTRVARYENADAATEAERDVTAALRDLPADHETLLARHVALHRPAYERVTLELDGHPLEALAAAGRYHLLSASGLYPPRLVGLWQGDWHAAWSGAFTLDANLNLQLAGAVTGDLPETVHALAELVNTQLPDWRDNARRVFGTRGAVSPVHTNGANGRGFHFNADYPMHLWTAGADWLLTTLLDHVAATGDRDFLRARVLPALTEVATFYADFLTRRDDNGRLIIVPSYSPENSPRGHSPAAVNATMDIAAARHALHAAADAHSELGLDPTAAQHWRALAEQLPPYRINDDGALAEWSWPGLPDAYDHRHISHLYPVWPLHEITPRDTPELAAAALRALRSRGHENDSAHGYLHQALVAARLGEAELAGSLLLRLLDNDFFYANLMSSHYPRGDVFNADASCALPGVLTELLLDSTPGRIRLLPAVPEFLPTGRLTGARTRARVTVTELTWDLPRATANATLLSESDRTIEVSHAHADRALRLRAGTPSTVLLDWSGDTVALTATDADDLAAANRW